MSNRLGIDPNKFKHVSSDDKMTVLKHKDGHELRIAHNILSPKMRAQLEALGKSAKDAKTPDQASEEKSEYSKEDTRPRQAKAKGGEIRKRYEDGGGVLRDPNPVPDEPRTAEEVVARATPTPEQMAVTAKEDAAPPEEPLMTKVGEAVGKYGAKHVVDSVVKGAQATGQAVGAIADKAGEFGAGLNKAFTPEEAPQTSQQPAQIDPNAGPAEASADRELAASPLRDQSQQEQAPVQPVEEAPMAQAAPIAVAAKPALKAAPVTPIQRAEATRKNVLQHVADYEHDLNMGHVKPKTYADLFANKGTLGKIGMIFGMMLSGAGSGLAHQKNALMEMMNAELDRDLKAQESSAANRQNFVKLAQEQVLQQAQASHLNIETKAQSYALAKSYAIASAMHKQAQLVAGLPPGSPQRAQAEQMLAFMGQASKDSYADLADKAAAQSAYYHQVLGDGSSTAVANPASEIRKKQLMGFITPQQSEAALKEVKDVENHVHNNSNALDSFDKVAKMSTTGHQMQNPIQHQRLIDAEWAPMIDKLTKDTEGRVTPITVDLMSALKPGMLDNNSTTMEKRRKLEGILNSGFSTPTLDSLGIPVKKAGPSTSPNEGKTITNRQTGQKMIMKNGQWTPYGGK